MILRLSPVAPLLAAGAMRAVLALTAGETALSDGVGGANGSGAVANGTGAGVETPSDPAPQNDRVAPPAEAEPR